MIFVEQTRTGAPGGNCFQACIASLIETDLEHVPDFHNLDGITDPEDVSWFPYFEEWFRENGNTQVVVVPGDLIPKLAWFTGITIGLTDTGRPHAVVYVDGKLAWNPAPGVDDDLASIDYGITFAQRSPWLLADIAHPQEPPF